MSPGAWLTFEPEDDTCQMSPPPVTVQREGGARQSLPGIPHVLRDLEPGTYVVSPGSAYWAVEPEVIRLQEGDRQTVVVRPRTRVEGLVVDEITGLPVHGATVRPVLRTPLEGGLSGYNQTGAPSPTEQGSFCMAGVPWTHDLMVSADAAGYLTGTSDWLSSDAGVQRSGIVVALSRPVLVSGTVVDAVTGDPVPGVLLRLEGEGSEHHEPQEDGHLLQGTDDLPHVARSAADGSFALRSPPGLLLLTATSEGYVRVALPIPALEPGPHPEQVVLLHRAAALRVDIHADKASPRPFALFLSAVEPDAIEHDAEHEGETYERATLLVDREFPCTVAFEDLPSGSYTLSLMGVTSDDSLSPDVLLDQITATVQAGVPQTVELFAAGVAARAALGGLLITVPEVPVTEVVIAVLRPGSRLAAGSTRADETGRFTMPYVREGTTCLVASHTSADGTRAAAAATVLFLGAGDLPSEAVLDLSSSRVRIVRAGEAGPALSVTFVRSGDAILDDLFSEASLRLLGDESGISEIYGLPDGEYALTDDAGQQRGTFVLGRGSRSIEVVVGAPSDG